MATVVINVKKMYNLSVWLAFTKLFVNDHANLTDVKKQTGRW